MAKIRPHHTHPLYLAFLLHRISGLALAIFLPMHFYILSTALRGAAELDSFLIFAELPLVKAAEAVLVFLLAVHLFGGIRLLALEWLPWSAYQKHYAALALAGSAFTAGLFVFQLL